MDFIVFKMLIKIEMHLFYTLFINADTKGQPKYDRDIGKHIIFSRNCSIDTTRSITLTH